MYRIRVSSRIKGLFEKIRDFFNALRYARSCKILEEMDFALKINGHSRQEIRAFWSKLARQDDKFDYIRRMFGVGK